MNIIDTHTHLYDEQFEGDLDDVMKRAEESGVRRMLLPNCDTLSYQRMMDLYHQYPDSCLPMLGLHPCYVKEDYREQLNLLYSKIDQANFVAIGEIGLDYYWDRTFIKEQKDAFTIQMQWAQDNQLPIAIHTRASLDDGIDMVGAFAREGLKGVFHCFSGDRAQARKIVDTGFYLGIGGVLTFKNSDLREILKDIPLEYILLETDAPYLAPVPYRGKRNESSYLTYVVSQLSGVYERPEEEIAEVTTENARRLFKL